MFTSTATWRTNWNYTAKRIQFFLLTWVYSSRSPKKELGFWVIRVTGYRTTEWFFPSQLIFNSREGVEVKEETRAASFPAGQIQPLTWHTKQMQSEQWSLSQVVWTLLWRWLQSAEQINQCEECWLTDLWNDWNEFWIIHDTPAAERVVQQMCGGGPHDIVGPKTMQSSLLCYVGTALLRLMIGSQITNTDCGAAKVVQDMLKSKVIDGGVQSAWLDLDRVVNRLCLIWIACHHVLICEFFLNSQGLIITHTGLFKVLKQIISA